MGFILPMDVQLLQAPFVEKAFFSPLNCFFIFVKNHLGIFMWVYFWVKMLLLCSIDLCVYPCTTTTQFWLL